jgi:hypothetical protein
MLTEPTIPAMFPIRYVKNALISVSDGKINIYENKKIESFDKKSKSTISFVIKDDLIEHYFHFMETMIWLYAIWKEYLYEKSIENIIFEFPRWSNEKQNNIQSTILSKLFPHSNKISIKEFKKIDEIHDLIIIDRSLGNSKINKFCEQSLDFAWKWAPIMKSEILSTFDLSRQNNYDKLKLIYITRNPPRYLVPQLEDKLLSDILKFGHVEKVDFSQKTPREQMEIALNADIMIGVHGNGLTNAFWLPPHATLIEIFPEGVHHYDYQLFCELLSLRYFGLEGELVYRDGSRFGPARGHDPHHNIPVEALNFKAIRNVVARSAAR